MNILYFSPVPFEPVRHGNMRRIEQCVKRLMSLGHNVYFVYLQSGIGLDIDFSAMQKSVTHLDIIKSLEQEKKKDEKGYDIFDNYYEEGLEEKIKELCLKYDIDTIICTYIWHSKLLEFLPDNITKIIDTHDKMTDRHISLEENNIKNEAFSCTEEDEARYLNRADIIWGIREEETEFFNKITNSNKAVTVTHFEPARFLKKKYSELNKIGILASNNQINYKMICNFIKLFNERIKSKPIKIEVQITGQVSTMIFAPHKPLRRISNFYYKLINRTDKIKGRYAHLFKKKYINVTGPIDNIENFYNNVDLVIIPIMYGTGINIKMVEAMAYGVPVISTECGIKGMDSDSKYHHCKDIDDLIDKIYEVYNTPATLQKLAEISEDCYTKFLSKATEKFDKNFNSNIFI